LTLLSPDAGIVVGAGAGEFVPGRSQFLGKEIVRMRMYRRIAVVAAVGVTALGAAACGPGGGTGFGSGAAGQSAAEQPAAGQVAVEVAAELSLEGLALAALGFPVADVDPMAYAAQPSPSGSPSAGPSASADGERARPWRKRHPGRVLLRRNTLHGEVVVQTKDGGTKTLVVQRGEVTAVNGTTMTVKSTDGYTSTWTFGDPIRVVERRTEVQPKDIAVGTQVGVAGAKAGDASTAKLIVVGPK
jgi:hypothetical protein